MVEGETKIVFVLLKEEHRRFMQNVKEILGEFQHALVIADIDKKRIGNGVRKTCAVRRKITLLKDVKIRMGFEEIVIKLVDVGLMLMPHLLEQCMDGF